MKTLFAIGQTVKGIAESGQDGCWMLEGLFETEQEAVENCTEDFYFVVPLLLGEMTGTEIPDGMWWPKLQTKEDGQSRIELFRKGLL